MHTASLQAARKALAQNVLFRRAQLRLSQTALCERAGVSRSVISAIENEEINATLEILARVSHALGIEFAELVRAQVQEGDSEADIQRRAKAGDDEFVDAVDFIAAIDDATGRRYSQAGRPRMANTASS
jgi:transcriptional regulator with XRE-family HTH domain